MSTTEALPALGFLARERTIANPGFSRWGRSDPERERRNRHSRHGIPLLQEVFGGRLIGVSATIPWTAATANLALFVAFFCVALSMYGGGFATVPAVDPKNFMTPEQIAADDAQEKAKNGAQAASASGTGEAQATWLVPAAWLAVWIPLGWGIWVTLQKAVLLFK